MDSGMVTAFGIGPVPVQPAPAPKPFASAAVDFGRSGSFGVLLLIALLVYMDGRLLRG